MANPDLSERILAAFTDALFWAGFAAVTDVDVSRGWGDTYFMTVHTLNRPGFHDCSGYWVAASPAGCI